ncbi:MAG: type II toxin-antitoxin system prevent-host-death family antitoxin [Litorimonas sp.]
MWTLQDAKARFSAVVDEALAGAPQTVSRRGVPSVVVVSVEDWDRMSGAQAAAGFAEHLAAIPTGSDDGDPFERPSLEARVLDL